MSTQRDSIKDMIDELTAKTDTTIKRDPERYARLAKPRPHGEARAAVEAFLHRVDDLRDEFGIADVNIVAAARSDHEKGSACSHAHFGRGANALPMAALAFRLAREDRRREEEELAGIGDESP